MRYDYIKHPEDRLYLRVGNLLTQLKSYANDKGNLEMYAYLVNVSRLVSPNDIDEVIKTEKHILSPNFLNQRCFKEIDKENLKPIIRDYKLNQLL
jgi:hypothetical protein